MEAEYKPKYEQSPTLNTVVMVEEVLDSMDESAIKPAELKRRLPKKINHNMFKIVLDYLEKSNKIFYTHHGIVWIFNDSPKMKEAISKGTLFHPKKI